MRAAGIPVKDKTPMPTTIVTRKRGPGRPPKSETLAKMQAELILQQQMEAAKASEPPVKRGRGRPRYVNDRTLFQISILSKPLKFTCSQQGRLRPHSAQAPQQV